MYQLQSNLQQKAALSAAISFWEQKEVKKKIKEFVNLCNIMKKDEIKNRWKKLIEIALEESNKNVLPPTLEDELIYFVKKTGEKVYNWCLHIGIENEFPFKTEKALNYFDEIYWTSHGTIDEVEIFKYFLSKNPSLPVDIMYHIACYYALEEYINDLWLKMPEDLKNRCDENIYKYADRHIWAYWKYRRDNDLSDLINYFDTVYVLNMGLTEEYDFSYRHDHSPEENMLWISIHQGYHIAAKYFWGKLSEDERNSSLVDCARMVITCYDFCDVGEEKINNYQKERYVEICIFLMKHMNKDQKELFFKEEFTLDDDEDDDDDDNYDFWNEDVKPKILVMLLSVWPWQELLIPVLNDMLTYLKDDSVTLCSLFYETSTKMFNEHKLGYTVKNSTYSNILQTAWCNIPESTKRKMITPCKNSFVNELLIVQDLESINFIFNDSKIADIRDHLIESGKKGYLQLIMNEQYEFLDQYIKKIFETEEEKRSFKQKMTIWKPFIEEKQIDETEELTTSDESEEKQYFQSGLDDIGLCEYFLKQKRYDSVDKYLNWKFETEEEKRNCKDHFKKKKFSIEQVYEIWKNCGTNVDKAKKDSSRFLHSFLESEEEIAHFKKEKIMKFDQKISFIDYIIRQDFVCILEDFFSWCSSSKEELQKIKQEIGYTMGLKICKDNISSGYIMKAEIFLRWAFSETELMESFIKEFIISDDGIFSCCRFIEKANTVLSPHTSDSILEKKVETLNSFIDFWIKPLKNISEFRIKFSSQKFDFTNAVQRESHKIFMDLLANLEKNN